MLSRVRPPLFFANLKAAQRLSDLQYENKAFDQLMNISKHFSLMEYYSDEKLKKLVKLIPNYIPILYKSKPNTTTETTFDHHQKMLEESKKSFIESTAFYFNDKNLSLINALSYIFIFASLSMSL